MRRAVMVAWLLGGLGALPLSAQETGYLDDPGADAPDNQVRPVVLTLPASPVPTATANEVDRSGDAPWQAVWGVAALRIIPAGPRTAPNGVDYHPNFSMDLDFNCWIWRSQNLYLFGDASLWGETGADGSTNVKDGFFATSKREFDLTGGVAWNYAGPWEARAFGYTFNNLNRGNNLVTPVGFTDGFGLENRYYLSPEYAKLGTPGFDVTQATFLSIGYYPSKDMVGNDGQTFLPGLLLRAYLTWDFGDWPVYAFVDATYISERTLQPRLLLVDVGIAARPFSACRQCEFRLGVDNTGDFQVRTVQNLWYGSIRYVY